MSIEVLNIFTSADNIEYLRKTIINQIDEDNIKNSDIIKGALEEELTQMVFDFQEYAIIENSGRHLRHSTSIKTEVDRLNNAFIKDRLAFARNFDKYAAGHEAYADQMFIDDSLRPGPYNHYNDCDQPCDNMCDQPCDNMCDQPCERLEKQRLFRYQDKYNSNRSSIPRWQVLKRGTPEQTNDELRNSELSQVRRASDAVKVDHIKSLSTDYHRPQWIDN